MFEFSSNRILDGTANDFVVYEEGGMVTSKIAKDFEEELKTNPAELRLRLRLLWYYAHCPNDDEDAKDNWLTHIRWMINERPTDWLTGNVKHHEALSEDDYTELEQLYFLQIKQSPRKAILRGRAGQFFSEQAPFRAEKYLLSAEKLNKREPDWSRSLSYFYMGLARSANSSAIFIQKALRAGNRALKKEFHPGQRDGLLDALSLFSFRQGKFVSAKWYARKRLKHAKDQQIDWYQHAAYTMLGKIEMRDGQISQAEKYLLLSTELDEFHPSVELANELWAAERFDVVFEYLNICAARVEGCRSHIEEIIGNLEKERRRTEIQKR